MTSPATMPPLDDSYPSGTWGEYQLLERVGQGSCAHAWLALRTGKAGFAKLLVLKVLRQDSGKAGAGDWFEREALALSRMNHPHVVQVIDVLERQGSRALVMEYIEGQALSQLQWSSLWQRWSLEVGLRVLHDILLGLDHVHHARDHDGSPLGMVHGDVSPNNVLVAYNGQAKLIDFGLSQRRGSVETGGGTLRYMAPERLLGDAVTPAADVYGVGVMLWELLARQRLWGDLDNDGMRSAVLAGMISTPLQSAVEHSSSPRSHPDWVYDLERACIKALSYYPEHRYASSAEFANALSCAPLASHADVCALLERDYGGEREATRREIAAHVTRLSNDARGGSPRHKIRRDHVSTKRAVTKHRALWPALALTSFSLAVYGMVSNTALNAGHADMSPDIAVSPLPFGASENPPWLTAPSVSPEADSLARSASPTAPSSPTVMPATPHLTSPAPRSRPSVQAFPFNPKPTPSHRGQAEPSSDPCSPRYYFHNGIKHFKPSCFR